MTDPRLENLISLADPSGKSRAVGVWPGGKSGPLHSIVLETKNAAEGFLRSAHDIRGNRNFGPTEAGTRMSEVAGVAQKSLNAAAVKINREKAVLRDKIANLNPTKGYRDQGHWQPEHDLRLIDWYKALPTPQREAIRVEIEQHPVVHLALSEAIMRTPYQLTGLNDTSRSAIRMGLNKAFNHDAFVAIDEAVQQLDVTEQALRLSVEAMRDTTGTLSDMAQNAPDSLALFTNAAEPLAWLS